MEHLDVLSNTTSTLKYKLICTCMPPGSIGYGDGTELTWGWWVSRSGRPRYYWGGGVPGLKMCDCGVRDTCTGNSLTCNCDGDGSDAPPLVDTGLLSFKVR